MRRSFFWCERAPGTTVALVVLGRWARLDFMPPALGRVLPCPASEFPLVRGFFVCKAPHRLRLVNFVNLNLRSEL